MDDDIVLSIIKQFEAVCNTIGGKGFCIEVKNKIYMMYLQHPTVMSEIQPLN